MRPDRILRVPLHPLVAEWDANLVGDDPLRFAGYADQLSRVDGRESVLTGRCEHYALIEGCFEVLGGSMGSAHGERVVRAYRRAIQERLPMVVVTSSGGARMQEGMVALIQMPRTAGAARAHADAGLLSIAVYRPPTTGGVFASYASLVDLRCAQPGATVAFAGPRVAEQTLGRRLPEGSHTAESAFDAGLVDELVSADEQAGWVEGALGLRDRPLMPPPLPRQPLPSEPALPPDDDHSAWAEVRRARHPSRPTGIDWAAHLCSNWTELRGVDPTVRAGLATFEGQRVVMIAGDRYAGDGRPRVPGFRLARRAIALAGRLGLPLVTLIDTPGADPGAASEAEGIATEIAHTLADMAAIPTPTVAVCVGEGGSGGALALAACDRLLIQRHAIFSVIGPEGAAVILERDVTRAADMAARLRLTSNELSELGIVDSVVPEDDLRTSLVSALAQARVGDRSRRFDAATLRWIR